MTDEEKLKNLCAIYYYITEKPISGWSRIEKRLGLKYSDIVEIKRFAAEKAGIELPPLVRKD